MVEKNFQSRMSLEKTKIDHETYTGRRGLEGMRLPHRKGVDFKRSCISSYRGISIPLTFPKLY